jgi:hypothetical protein
MSGSPRSFGRAHQEQPVEAPKEHPAVQVPGGLRLVDGRLVLEVDLIPLVPEEVLQAMYDQVRDVVALAVADGFAAATGQERKDVDELLPPAAAEPAEPEPGPAS